MRSTSFESSDIRLGVARGVSYGLFGPPDDVAAARRELAAGLIRVYVYWGQVQPEPDRWDWTTVDSFLAQLVGEEEVWVTVCSSSPWATRESSDFLPPSPAKDEETFDRFVRALVSRCGGRVRYWQCNNEPSNVGLLWAGTATEYAAQLEVFQRAVRESDPSSLVVLGGCGYDVLSAAPGDPPRRFFEHLLGTCRDWFDLFAVHLYDEPSRIPHHIETVRAMMRAHGYERPVIVGEYNGPTLFQLPELEQLLHEVVASTFADSDTGDGNELSTEMLAASASIETPERRAMKTLYARMPELPPRLQMLMAGCSAELEERRHRINCREIVTRNVLALSTGVRRTVCWRLAPEVAGYEDPFTMMELLQGKLLLLRHDDSGRLTCRQPAAETFQALAQHLDGARAVMRIELDSHPEVSAFAVERRERPALAILWKDGDLFSGEDEPATVVEWPWPHDDVDALDALGAHHALDRHDVGHLAVPVSITPLILIPPTPTS